MVVACHPHRGFLTRGPHTAPPPQTQQSKFVNWQVDGEYRGSDFTAAVTLGNPDVLVGSGKRWGAHWYSRSLGPDPLSPQGAWFCL